MGAQRPTRSLALAVFASLATVHPYHTGYHSTNAPTEVDMSEIQRAIKHAHMLLDEAPNVSAHHRTSLERDCNTALISTDSMLPTRFCTPRTR